MRVAVINVGIGRWHPRGSARLKNSLINTGFNGDILCWTDNYPKDCPPHHECNYAFKPYAFGETLESYDIVIWMDSAVYAKKSIQPIIDHIDNNHYLLLQNGWTSGEWLCDNQLEPLGISREQSFQYPHVMACVMGFDLRINDNIFLLDNWKKLSEHFSGEWNNTGVCSKDKRVLGSRHDQSFISVLAHDRGYKLTDSKGILSYNIHDNDTILVTQGMT